MTNIGMVRSLVRCVVKCLVRCSSGSSPLYKGFSGNRGDMLEKGLTPYPPLLLGLPLATSGTQELARGEKVERSKMNLGRS